MCTQGLSAPVWDQTQTDPLPCARGLSFHIVWGVTRVMNIDQVLTLGPFRLFKDIPKTQYGEKQLRFQERWYVFHDWLEYTVEKDAIFCFPSRIFGVLGEFLSFCFSFKVFS